MKKILSLAILAMFFNSAFAEGIVCVTKSGIFLFNTSNQEYEKIAELGKLIPYKTKMFISSFADDSVTFVLYDKNTACPGFYQTTDWEHFEYVYVYKHGIIKQIAVNRFYKEGGSIILCQTSQGRSTKTQLNDSVMQIRYSGQPLYNRFHINEDSHYFFNIRGTKRQIDDNNCLLLYFKDRIERFFCGQARLSMTAGFVYRKKVMSYFMEDIRPQYDYALFTKKIASVNGKKVWEYSVTETDIATRQETKTWRWYYDMVYSFSGRYLLAKNNSRYRVIDRENEYAETLLRKDVANAFWLD